MLERKDKNVPIELKIVLIAVGSVTAVAATLYLLSLVVIPKILYNILLTRKKKGKWGRECSLDDPIQRKMYDDGCAWGAKCEAYKKDVHIFYNGANLYGEYFDFGNRRAVVIIGGRQESLRYAYYFANEYAKNGYNVLTIDQRAHGESDGVYNTVGHLEHKDLLEWTKYIHDEFNLEEIFYHGICIGSACALYAITSEDCPDYVIGMVADGMFTQFRETFKNHIIEFKQPIHPFLEMVDFYMRRATGFTMNFGPIDVIHKMKKPLLMLHSREDIYSRPELAEVLYEKCPSEHKEIVWFDHGAHSQLRIADTEKYDKAVGDFLKTLHPELAEV